MYFILKNFKKFLNLNLIFLFFKNILKLINLIKNNKFNFKIKNCIQCSDSNWWWVAGLTSLPTGPVSPSASTTYSSCTTVYNTPRSRSTTAITWERPPTVSRLKHFVYREKIFGQGSCMSLMDEGGVGWWLLQISYESEYSASTPTNKPVASWFSCSFLLRLRFLCSCLIFFYASFNRRWMW